MGAVGRSSGALIHQCVGKIAGYRQEMFPAVQRHRQLEQELHVDVTQ